MHYLLIYDVVDDYVAKRAAFRAEHLELAQTATKQGDLLLGGALVEPVDKAILLFRSQQAAETFVASDPYVRNGLVISWAVRQWSTVAGCMLDA